MKPQQPTPAGGRVPLPNPEDVWRYACPHPGCGSVTLKTRKEYYTCPICERRFVRPLDKKTGRLVGEPRALGESRE